MKIGQIETIIENCRNQLKIAEDKLEQMKRKKSKPRVLIGHKETDTSRTLSNWSIKNGSTFKIEIRFEDMSQTEHSCFNHKELVSDIQCYLDNFY